MITILVLLMLINVSFVQETEKSNSKTYKNARVKLTTGEIIRCKSLTIFGSDLKLTSSSSYSPEYKTIALKDVEQIQTMKNKLLSGTVIGVASGTVVMLIIKYFYEKPEETHATTLWYNEGLRTGEVSNKLPLKFKILSVFGGGCVGASIGSEIKGWLEVYSKEKENKKVSLEFAFSDNYSLIPTLNLKLRF